MRSVNDRPCGLAPSFLTTWRGSAPGSVDALEAALVEMHAEGHRAFPDVDLDAADLAAHAGERARTDVSAAEAASELRAADLFLACACTRGSPAAVRAFDGTLMARVPLYLRPLRVSSDVEEETRQTLLVRLLVAAPGAEPRIAQYQGRGALGAWVRVSALRTALVVADQRQRAAVIEDEGAAIAGAVGEQDDPDLLFLKASLREPFRVAFRAAIAELSQRDRALLRFAFVEGLPPEPIGKLYGVHRTTVMRWLDAARAAVLAGTRSRLATALQLLPGEDLFELVRSRFDVTLTSLLRTDP